MSMGRLAGEGELLRSLIMSAADLRLDGEDTLDSANLRDPKAKEGKPAIGIAEQRWCLHWVRWWEWLHWVW